MDERMWNFNAMSNTTISHRGHWWRRLQPTSSIITDAKSVDSNLYDFARQGWRRLNYGADVITGLSRRHACRFSKGYISISTRRWHLSFLYSSKRAKNYIYAKIQAETCMFTQQNRLRLNRPILRPLWLMTSATAEVISVPCVHFMKLKYSGKTRLVPLLLMCCWCSEFFRRCIKDSASTVMVLYIHHGWVCVFCEKGFQLPGPFRCWEIIENALCIFYVTRMNSVQKSLNGLKYFAIESCSVFMNTMPGPP